MKNSTWKFLEIKCFLPDFCPKGSCPPLVNTECGPYMNRTLRVESSVTMQELLMFTVACVGTADDAAGDGLQYRQVCQRLVQSNQE